MTTPLDYCPTLGPALVLTSLLWAAFLTGCASPAPPPTAQKTTATPSKLSEKARQEQQQAIIKIRDQTLRQLHKLKPSTKAEIDQSAGYGVFEINGLNAVLAETHGRGVVIAKNGGVSYMQLARTDIRPGIPLKPYRQVLIFRDPQKLNQFVAAGSPSDVAHDPSIKVYQLNEKGVAAQSDWAARYFRNPDLN